MNREILFRGQHVDTKQWYYGYLVKQYGATQIYLPNGQDGEFGSDYTHVIPETVGQYTGLTDKNGKKIFDGDIIKHYNGNPNKGFDVGIVYWSSDEAAFRRTCVRIGTKHPLLHRICVYEVIGNVHDNPELLERAADGADQDTLMPAT